MFVAFRLYFNIYHIIPTMLPSNSFHWTSHIERNIKLPQDQWQKSWYIWVQNSEKPLKYHFQHKTIQYHFPTKVQISNPINFNHMTSGRKPSNTKRRQNKQMLNLNKYQGNKINWTSPVKKSEEEMKINLFLCEKKNIS